MPKPRSRKRWEHPSYRYAYCVERYDNVYTVIDNTPPVAIKGMKWKPENRNEALRILDERLRAKQSYDNGKLTQTAIEKIPKTIYQAIEEFSSIEFKKFDHATVKSYLSAFNKYLPEDLQLNDVVGIRKLINDKLLEHGHKSSTQLKYIAKLNRLFEFCISQEYMPRNPILKGMKPDEEENEVRPYTLEEMQLLYDYFISQKNVVIPIGEGKNRIRKRSEAEEKEEYAYMLMLIATIGTRATETINIWWDVQNAPLIPYSINRKSIILPSKIIIDGKRSKKSKPRIREFPIELVPQTLEVLELLKKFKERNQGKLLRWNTLAKPEYWLREAVKELKLEPGRSLHSIRKTATNWWEKELGIPSNICAYMAGHNQQTRTKYYEKDPTAEQLVNMHGKKVNLKFVSSSFQEHVTQQNENSVNKKSIVNIALSDISNN
jgi:integrase